MQAESNRVDIRISEETAWAEVPSSPTMAVLPYTSEGLIYDKRTVKSNIVRADRLTDDIVEVGAGSNGDLNIEYKFGDFEKLIEGALGSKFVTNTATYTGSGGAGDLSFAVSGGGVQVITGPASTWNNFDVGAYVRVSGATQSANNGVFRITAITSTDLTVTNAAGVSENNSTATVSQKMARTGVNKYSYLIEKSFGDITQFLSFRGLRVATWAMNVEAEQIVTGSFGFMGEGVYAAGSTISGAITPASSNSIASATANVGRLEEGGATLTTAIKAVRFNLNANPRQLTAVANKFPIGINLGSFEITGSVEAYFEDLALYNKFVNHSDSSLVLEIDSPEDDRTIITITNLKFTNGNPVGAGLNQDVMVTMDFTAKNDAVSQSMMQVDLLT